MQDDDHNEGPGLGPFIVAAVATGLTIVVAIVLDYLGLVMS